MHSLPESLLYYEHQVFPERQGKWKATTQSREFLKSIKRYYSNTYTDGEKQDAINLYLFLPIIVHFCFFFGNTILISLFSNR